MKETNIEWNCRSCKKPFLLFSDDTANDSTICWNYCPHCGERNDIWIRFLNLNELKRKDIPYGLGCVEASKLQSDKEFKEAMQTAGYISQNEKLKECTSFDSNKT